MFSPFCLCGLAAEGPWSTLQAGTRAVHMNALWGKEGKLPGQKTLGAIRPQFQAQKLIVRNL